MQLPSFLPEMILFFSIFIQLFCLTGIKSKAFSRLFYIVLSSGIFLALIAAIYVFSFPAETMFGTFLKSEPLFRPTRISILLSTIVLMRFIFVTKSIPEYRKRDVLFLLSAISFLAFILILSENLLVSFLCMFGISAGALFLSGLPFSGRKEGEAVLKFWVQFALILMVGGCGLIFLASQAGGLAYADLRVFYATAANNDLYFFWVVLGIAPFLLLAGIFPFHFLSIDRDHGCVWPLQAVNSIIVSGTGVIALFKATTQFFFSPTSAQGSPVLFLVATLACIGLLWNILGAITQSNTKRFMAYFSAAQWSFCLLVMAGPTVLSVSAVIFQHANLSICLCLLFWGLTSLHEKSSNMELWGAITGHGNRRLLSSRMLFLGMMPLMFLPPSSGWVVLLNLLGSIFEQQKIILLLFCCIGLILTVMAALQLLTNIFFSDSTDGSRASAAATPGINKLDGIIFFACLLIIMANGIYGDFLMKAFSQSAKIFIIS